MGHATLLLALAALLGTWDVAFATFSLQEAGVRVVIPSDPNRPAMRMTMADFGRPRYGGKLIGNLIYPSSQPLGNQPTYQCLPEDCQYGCTSFNFSKPRLHIQRQPGVYNIMLLDRGPRGEGHESCYFLDKVFNAQEAGADAVLIANDEPGELSTAVAPEDDPITDRELSSLSISAAMISLEDGRVLKALLGAAAAAAAGGGGVGGGVTLLLNWTAALPQQGAVSWEFWSDTNFDCGFSCTEQRAFLKDMAKWAKQLQTSYPVSFAPHYLLWSCPAGSENTTECKSECIAGGRYCIPDPDGNYQEGYSGRDVLMMNVRSLCFYKQVSSSASTSPAAASAVWWDYISRFAAACLQSQKSYDAACATKVVSGLVSEGLLAAGQWDMAAWEQCSQQVAGEAAAAGSTASVPILEEELAAQRGNNDTGVNAVTILPTIRINGGQYRGSLNASYVLRALCAGFPAGQEPQLCNGATVSEDECAEGGEGYRACMAGSLGNKTRCVNTFQGWSCECRQGMVKATNPLTGEESCEDVNECTASLMPAMMYDCNCPRCACINTLGGFRCSGWLNNVCNEAGGWGGCWHTTLESGETFHACQDNVHEYIQQAARGRLDNDTKWYTCECPPCFRRSASSPPGGSQLVCEPACADMAACDRATGFCRSSGSSSGAGGGGGANTNSNSGGSADGSKRGGVSVGFLLLVAVASAGLTGAVVLAAQRLVVRQRMGEEIRDIMAQYMPLQTEHNQRLLPRPHGGAGGAAPGGFSGIRPDEDSDEDNGTSGVGAYGWPAAATSKPAAVAAAPPLPLPAAAPASIGLGPLSSSSSSGPSLAGAAAASGGQRAVVWGPPPASASLLADGGAKPAAGSSSAGGKAANATQAGAAAAATSRPAVDVFTIGGPEEEAGDPLQASQQQQQQQQRSGGAGGGGGDPLLGL
ncbi:hypothetical protein Agub_g10664 [Astrephomene gubernaculifera]|uniref:PA domain-containing protein n=1 Tax=Astrephomene gubernaculifera TaxID=47775 RepID=A0AAD3HPW1_9CHLO|nr:hypothetical protein Agub_g10664 [Astrephomene gubernaculifera]